MTNGNDLMHDPNIYTSQINCGLTKREYFAAMAMQGILAQHEPGGYNQENAEYTCRDAVLLADALITALNKQQ